jgi:hypothetical protein
MSAIPSPRPRTSAVSASTLTTCHRPQPNSEPAPTQEGAPSALASLALLSLDSLTGDLRQAAAIDLDFHL